MAPKTEEQLNRIREEKKSKILDTALKLFAYNGFDRTTISKIAKDAEVSKGLIYNYFESKEEILKGIINQAETESDNIMNEMKEDDPKQNIRVLFEAFFRQIKKNQEFWKLTLTLSLRANEFPYIKEMVTTRLEEYIAFLKELFNKAGIEKPSEEARILGATMDGVVLHYVLADQDYPIDDIKNGLINRYTKP